MKALNFLERIKELSLLYNLGKITAEQYAKAIVKTIEFYSQPFKPEMITEYFEGWEKTISTVHDFSFISIDNDMITGYNTRGTDLVVISNFADEKSYKFKIPKTLDSFKTLLEEQCGIELTFKQEIINQYFK